MNEINSLPPEMGQVMLFPFYIFKPKYNLIFLKICFGRFKEVKG